MSAVNAISMFDAMPEVEKRKWEHERKIVRKAILRAKSLPKSDRECLMYCANLWFYHRNGDGFIHPGAKLLSEKLECSIRTVKSIVKRLRDDDFLVIVAYPKGGRNATWYAVNIARILERFSARPHQFALDWDEIHARSIAQVNRAKIAANRAKVAHGIVKASLKETVPESFNDPSDWSEVPF